MSVKLDRGKALAVLWTAIIILMAVSDARTQLDDTLKTTYWLVFFFVGVAGSAMLLIQPLWRGIGGFLLFAGLFLGLYNLTWYVAEIEQGQIMTFPLQLYPFALSVTAPEWWALILLGWVALVIGVLLLERRPIASRWPSYLD